MRGEPEAMNTDETGGRDLGIRQSESRNPSETCAADRERVELLKAVADCWPKNEYPWQAAIFAKKSHFVEIALPAENDAQLETGFTESAYLELKDDAKDATVIVLMLDAMEKAGMPTVRFYRIVREWHCEVPNGYGDFEGSGPTRAYALAQAFVDCFRTASQNGLSNAPPATTNPQTDSIPEGEK